MSNSSEFYPRYALISTISRALNAVVTFTAAHDFTDGEVISFRVSRPYGMVEMNNRQATVSSHDSTTVTVPIDSSNFTPFVTSPSGDVASVAMAVPSASGIIPNLYTATINLEDSFDDRPV